MARRATGGRRLRDDGADFFGSVFRVLPVDALLHGDRQDQAGAGQGGLSCLRQAD